MEAAGARLISYHTTTGEFDFHIIVETAEIDTVMAMMAVTAASAGVTDLKTVLAFTGAQSKAALVAGQALKANFRSAGA